MYADVVEFIKVEDIIEVLPHKFRNGKNVKIIIDAYYKQYYKMINTLVVSVLCYNLDRAKGEQLDKIGSNFLVRRDNLSDDDYRNKIKLTFAIYKASGSIYNISKIFIDYLGVDLSVLKIYEAGGAKIVLELDRNNALGGNLVNAINDIIQFSKPVGVGFSIEPFSSASILDKYSVMAIESEID
ncbi:MAG: hypothetical protein ACRCXT_19050, partial [Paraclostridium sp.]